MEMHSPVHPGDLLKAEILEAYGLTVTEAATILGVSRPALSNLLNQHVALTPAMAIRFEKAFGVAMDLLLRMQSNYDIAEARKTAHTIQVRRYRRAG